MAFYSAWIFLNDEGQCWRWARQCCELMFLYKNFLSILAESYFFFAMSALLMSLQSWPAWRPLTVKMLVLSVWVCRQGGREGGGRTRTTMWGSPGWMRGAAVALIITCNKYPAWKTRSLGLCLVTGALRPEVTRAPTYGHVWTFLLRPPS